MRTGTVLITAVFLLTACGRGGPVEDNATGPDGHAASTNHSAAAASAGRWDLQSSGEGAALAFAPPGDGVGVRLFCPAGRGQLIVNVPSFRPIGSEERMTFGSGGEAHVLVADSRGDTQRGGVTGSGPVPANLAVFIAGPVSVNYGAQNSGPHPAPPAHLVGAFVGACGARAAGPVAPKPVAASPCLTQDGKPVPANRLRAIGTEPFWGARIDGRCVTYSNPEDQAGTRVWTRFAGSATSGSWTGSLGGKPFVLRTRPQAGCSDGMSDNRYPIAVSLTVGGEQRSGCAEPL